ncbi:MAG: toxin-activating lysine-acyltransferase [Alphaproteobacteria bacterium]|nr:toxin-activating lysine-acyltransferase [Alphaproteobacteria bacterium]
MSASPEQVSASPMLVPAAKNGVVHYAATSAKPKPSAPAARKRTTPPRARAHVLGEIVTLLTRSAAHKHIFVSDLDWFIGPPMMLGQFRNIYASGRPVALWASVSEEVEKELLAGRMRLRPTEWRSGDRLWLIAPSFASDAGQASSFLPRVAREVFGGKPFKMLRPTPETRLPESVEVSSGSDTKVVRFSY